MSDGLVLTEVRGQLGCITLNRARALNSLNLDMVRSVAAVLQQWASDASVKAVAIRGMGKTGPFGNFCAGGDIRFFHQAALAGNPALEDFFTEEYALNHLVHHYAKPIVAFMDGVVMGGGMGLAQGASHRVVTGCTKMAMPETLIGLFPDVGGGYFLSRCPGRTGEWQALTGEIMDGATALELGLADVYVDEARLEQVWEALATASLDAVDAVDAVDTCLAIYSIASHARSALPRGQIDQYFSLNTVPEIMHALEADDSDWARHTAALLRKRSPLMLYVVLEQVRRARTMTLAQDLRMERDMVRHCFSTLHLGRSGPTSETVEGIRALAVDKDYNPQWNPARIEEVSPEQVAPFLESPWPAWAHPLRHLG